jgi:hypothetical protein
MFRADVMTAVKSGIIFKSNSLELEPAPTLSGFIYLKKENQCSCNPQSNHFLLIPTKKSFETTTKLWQLYDDPVQQRLCCGYDKVQMEAASITKTMR